MSYNDKAILEDVNGVPIPQGYSPSINDYEPAQVYNGAILTYQSGSASETAVFQSATSAISVGVPFNINGLKEISISIKGTPANTARTVVFEQSDVDGNWFPIVGVRDSSADVIVATETTGKDEVWQFAITGKSAIRMRIAAITGGTLTIKGKAVV